MFQVNHLIGFGATVTPPEAPALVGGEALVHAVATETDAMGIDFTYDTDRSVQMHVLTSSVGVDSDPYSTLTYTSPSLKMCRQSDGVWRYGNHNFFQRSQEFDNAYWTKVRSSVSADSTTAPDGTSTADTLVEDSSNNTHYMERNDGGAGNKFYIFAKAKERSWFRVETFVGAVANFDVGNGVTGSASGGTTAAITNVGNGWYLCTWDLLGGSNGGGWLISIATANQTVSYAGDGTSGLYFWGAQSKKVPVQDSATVAGYIATTTAAKYDLPYEWDANGDPQGILHEPARTNLCLRSQELDNASWTKTACSISADATTAPDGTSTADKIVENSASTSHQITQAITVTASTNYTASVYVKSAGRTEGVVEFSRTDGSGGCYAIFNLSTGALITSAAYGTGTIVGTPVAVDAGNSWWRIQVTGTINTTTARILVAPSTGGAGQNYAGNGSDGIYAWGATLELGSVASSPIHTIGATVTRALDNINMATSVIPYSDTAGTLYSFFVPFDNLNTYVFDITDSTTDNDHIAIRSNFTNPIFFVSNESVVVNNLDGGTIAANAANKIAGAYAASDQAVVHNGNTAVTDTQATPASGNDTDKIFIGNGRSQNLDRWLHGYIKHIAYYQRRISNADMQTLTT